MSVLALVLLLIGLQHVASSGDTAGQFIYNGFAGASLALDGAARVAPSGLLALTNGTVAMTGHALHPLPIRFREPNGTASVRSFSAAFVFAIVSPYLHLSSHGMAFFVSRSRNLSTTMPFQYLGLLNTTDGRGSPSNHVLAVELDTVLNYELADMNDNHVGIDVDSLRSAAAASAGYYDDGGAFRDLSLYSREAMQVWVDYDGGAAVLDVTLAPLGVPKPKKPLLSHAVDLSSLLPAGGEAYVGFSSSTGVMACSHYVLGWSFSTDGAAAPALNVSRLPGFPRPISSNRRHRNVLAIVLPVAAVVAAAVVTAAAVLAFVRRRMEYVELREDWEAEFGAHRFAYKDLHRATGSFAEKSLVGRGGSGEVYKGVLPRCNTEVAVKRMSDQTAQGTKAFIAEVASMGRLRHRNLVPLLGYCRRKGELLLVYRYMSNGSLEKFLHDHGKLPLGWDQRFRIIRDIASGLFYLHEEWEHVIVHRDVKPSNVLLDDEMNGRLGDFGLARLCDGGHGAGSYTTRVVGTTGYLAPELMRKGEASPATDVFAFGAFVLEVACGRRPVENGAASGEEAFVLVDHVLGHWHGGSLMEAVDSKLQGSYDADEVDLALKLGLLCMHPLPGARPSMRQVVQYLDGGAAFPELVATSLSEHSHHNAKTV